MDKRGHVITLVLILTIGLLLPVASGENCPVNPDCSCSGTDVYCYPKCGPSVPKFAASSKQFNEARIYGNRDINQILPGTFQNFSTTRMYIRGTGITDVDCDAFKGIASGLTTLTLTDAYLQSVPSCSLQHVKKIQVLHFRGNHISNITRDSFINAPGLISLYLEQNEIETIEVGSFNTMKYLNGLNLDNNNISTLDGSVFKGLSYLRTLIISRNKLKSIHPKLFDGLEALSYLRLDQNEIGLLDGTTFEHLINMANLRLGSNLIVSLPEIIFSKSVKLNSLYLEDNQLVSLPDNIFQTTPLLTSIYIQRNNLSAISYKLFSSTPKLQILDMSGNRIVNLDPETFKDCGQLRQVTIKNNEIRDLQPGSFRNLSSLFNLDLSENYLTEIRTGVFDNSTSLDSLNLGDNRISFIEDGVLASQQKSLKTLFLQSNQLTYKAWVTLQPILIELENLTYLDLSHNPIGDLPTPVLDSINHLLEFRLRNCSISNFPANKTSFGTLDLSANELKNISDFVLSATYNNFLNVSYSNLQSIALWASRRSRQAFSMIDAQHNDIKNVDIFIKTYSLSIRTFQFSNNSMTNSICLKSAIFRIYLHSLDLSYNKFNNVTNYPVRYDSSVSIYSNEYRYITIRTLNLSHNNINFVSPEALLGRIYNLDLSHNRIQTFGRLLPCNALSWGAETQYLDLSWNFIHQISSDVFCHGMIIRNIDLAQNSLTEIQSLRNVLQEESLQRLNLSDNPLNCDCESFWLRQDSVSFKLDSIRCDTPDNVKGYMSFCYPLENCSPNQKLNISSSVLDLCKNDVHVIISTLQLNTLETVGNSFIVNVTWTSQGPRQITGYRLEIRSSGNSDSLMTSLVHPAALNYIIFGLELEMTYNVCISAQREQVTVSEVMCKSLQVEATDDNITTRNSTLMDATTDDNSIIISKSTLIGISSTMGLCVLCIVLMLSCYFFRIQKLKCCHEPPYSDRRERPQIQQCPRKQYEDPPNINDDVPDSNTYETIHHAAYENWTNQIEDEDNM